MTNKPCVTILDHDDDYIRIEIDGLYDTIRAHDGLSVYYGTLPVSVSHQPADITKLTFDGFTIHHQKGVDCYVE